MVDPKGTPAFGWRRLTAERVAGEEAADPPASSAGTPGETPGAS